MSPYSGTGGINGFTGKLLNGPKLSGEAIAIRARPVQITDRRATRIVNLLVESFENDPLIVKMCGRSRFRRRNLFRLAVRMHRDIQGPVFAVEQGDELIGVAVVTEPGVKWRGLVRALVALGLTVNPLVALRGIAPRRSPVPLPIPDVHHVVQLLAVHQAHRGRGLSRVLLNSVHELAAGHPESGGILLETGNRDNVGLYQHLGYRVVGRKQQSGTDSFYLFRSSEQEPE